MVDEEIVELTEVNGTDSGSDTSQVEFVQENGQTVIHGGMRVEGNLDVGTALSTQQIVVSDENGNTVLTTNGRNETISFRKACEFQKNVKFNSGKTLIGIEPTYNSAYVGSPTIHAGQRLIVGDSFLKIDAESRKIIADTFKMILSRLYVDSLTSKNSTMDNLTAKTLKVSGDLTGVNINADVIRTKQLYLDKISSRQVSSTQTLTAQNLVVEQTAKVLGNLMVQGVGSDGAAINVTGGPIIATKGISSNTRNNYFQCLKITGSGVTNDTCFVVDNDVSSKFLGNVTVENANLVLDNSNLIADNLTVASVSQDVTLDSGVNGVQITTDDDWETYEDGMIVEEPTHTTYVETYDPYQVVQDAICRNESNYIDAQRQIKTLITPINYAMEQGNQDIPKKFSVKKPGICRIDLNGNALMRNVVSECGKFSRLEAFEFHVNQLSIDKIQNTSVASNVLHSDQVLRSDGIAEFNGVVNSKADVFIEKNSYVNVADGAALVLQKGSALKVESGSQFTICPDANVTFNGNVELDLNKLVFVDSNTGHKYKIMFYEKPGTGEITMSYKQLGAEESRNTRETANQTERSSRSIVDKLKTIGL